MHHVTSRPISCYCSRHGRRVIDATGQSTPVLGSPGALYVVRLLGPTPKTPPTGAFIGFERHRSVNDESTLRPGFFCEELQSDLVLEARRIHEAKEFNWEAIHDALLSNKPPSSGVLSDLPTDHLRLVIGSCYDGSYQVEEPAADSVRDAKELEIIDATLRFVLWLDHGK